MGFLADIFRNRKNEADESREYAEFLVKELENLKKETNEALEKDRQIIKELEEKVRESERAKLASLESMSKVLTAAKTEADRSLEEARAEAEEIRRQAKLEVQIYRQKIEMDEKEKIKGQQQQFLEAKKQLIYCLDTLNQSQARFMQAYEEMGKLLKRLPIQMNELFPGEDLGFLLEKWDIHNNDETVEFKSEE